jgi:hypothetical protein
MVSSWAGATRILMGDRMQLVALALLDNADA